jgi:predicted lipoprotein with Yx(FWY)xxD motif
MMFRLLVAAAVVLAAGQAFAHGSESSAPPPAKKGPPAAPAQVVFTEHSGAMLTDPRGMTLYTFDRDVSGDKSNCDDKCAEKWVPFAASSDDTAFGDFTVITRGDGSKMWAYRYRPLYTSRDDKTPGEINGLDTNNLWHVARPAY